MEEKQPLYVRLPQPLREKLDAAVQYAGTTTSEFVREVLEARLQSPADLPVLTAREMELVREFTRMLLFEAPCDRYMLPHIIAHLEDPENRTLRDRSQKEPRRHPPAN